MQLLIRGGILVTADGAAPSAQRGDILVSGDRIAAIGPKLAEQLTADARGCEVIDASRSIVLPGLVNAHIHSNEGFEQGAYDNLPLELWLLESYPPWGLPRFSERQHYLRAMLTAMVSIRSGVTSVQDDLLDVFAAPEALDGTAAAYRDAGLRAFITVSMWDRPLVECLPYARESIPAALQAELAATPPPSAADFLALFERHYKRWQGEAGRVNVILGPCAPQRCTDGLLAAVGDLSARPNVPVHSHVLETRTQAVTAQVRYGKTLIEHLHALGLLSPRLTINHGIWLTPNDIELLGQHGCSVTHNPLSNLKLGSGVCPVRELLAAGANVALGTDGLTTSDTADLVEALHLAALLHKIGSPNYEEWGTAQQAFRMATLGGARSCLADREIGSLTVGKKADIILLDVDAWGFIPLHDPIRQLAFSITSEAVTHTIVDGRVLMRDRRITVVDENAVKAEVAEFAEQFRRDMMPKMRAGAARLAPCIDAIYRKAMATPLPGDWDRMRLRPSPAARAAQESATR